MAVWVALLRGVNVGGHNRLPMAELRAALTDAGLGRVTTYIASGNIVLDADDQPTEPIGRVIAERFGLDIDVMARTGDQIRAVVAANPFTDAAADEPKSVSCFFTSSPVTDAVLDGFDNERYAPDVVATAEGELFAHYPNGMATSKLTNTVLDRVAGGTTTARNWNTVRKLAQLVATAEA